MPKYSNGARRGSIKRRDTTSTDGNKDQEFRSPDSLDLSHRNTEEPQHPAAVLGSSKEALRRLAAIANLFQSSFIDDIKVIEGTYRTELVRENEIQRLNETVETILRVKSEEVENLRRENEELQAGQADCERERQTCRTMRVELETQHAAAEVDRNKDFTRKIEDERAKSQKSLRAKKAEMEAGTKAKFRELGDQNEKLLATNEGISQRLVEAERKLEIKKIRHARTEKSLEEDNEKLSVELEQIKSEFPVEGQPAEFYAEKFQHIADIIKAISSKYFQKLPKRALMITPSLLMRDGTLNPEAVHQELSKLNPIFDSTPIWQSEISEFLRLRDVQHIISICLCDYIWQPFFLQDSLPNHEMVGRFLKTVSTSLSASGGRSETVWRVLTLRGIDDHGAESRLVKSTADQVLKVLEPLIIPSESAEFEKDLVDIINQSITLWKTTLKDEAKFIIEKCPDSSDDKNWQAEDIQDTREASMPPEEWIDTTGINPLCLFPNVLQKNLRGETVTIHRGSVVFPTSRVRREAILEKKEQEEELAKALLDARSKIHARRISCSAGPKSPMGGNSSLTQT